MRIGVRVVLGGAIFRRGRILGTGRWRCIFARGHALIYGIQTLRLREARDLVVRRETLQRCTQAYFIIFPEFVIANSTFTKIYQAGTVNNLTRIEDVRLSNSLLKKTFLFKVERLVNICFFLLLLIVQ